MMGIQDVSWIKKKQQLSLDALKTPNRLDDNVYIRGHNVKPELLQKQTNPKVNISDAMFNNIEGIGAGGTLTYNKARLKLFGPKINKLKEYVGKRKGLDHI